MAVTVSRAADDPAGLVFQCVRRFSLAAIYLCVRLVRSVWTGAAKRTTLMTPRYSVTRCLGTLGVLLSLVGPGSERMPYCSRLLGQQLRAGAGGEGA